MSGDDLAPHLAEEARDAWSLWKAGVIRESYLRTDRPGAALVLEVTGIEHTRVVLAGLPLVRHCLVEFECLAVVAFMGFDALLDGCSMTDRIAGSRRSTDHEWRTRE